MVLARTPKRPGGHECRVKCGKADADCDNPMQRVCHDCLAAKRSSKGKGKAVKPQAGTRKASDTGGVDDTTGQRGGAPPAYVEFSSHFVSLESAAGACANGDALLLSAEGQDVVHQSACL